MPTPRTDQVGLYIAAPSYQGMVTHERAIADIYRNHPEFKLTYFNPGTSLLAANFNTAWSSALNQRHKGRATHFLMIHADVEPHGADWFDVLWEEMIAKNADVVSVIIPLKDRRGLTSTAKDTHPYRPVRYTMRQVFKKPPTWTEPDLLFNTGLMLVDFRKPWVEQFHFTINDEIERLPTGEFVVNCEPEDWNFSRFCRKLSLRYFVTRKVHVSHWGMVAHDNDQPWGEWEEDKDNLRWSQ